MLNLHDDLYECREYTCCGCEQRDYLLKEAANEISSVMKCLVNLKKNNSELEEKLLSNLENACHMVGIPFKWS